LLSLLVPFSLQGGTNHFALRKSPGAKGRTNEKRIRGINDGRQFAIPPSVGSYSLPHRVALVLSPSLEMFPVGLGQPVILERGFESGSSHVLVDSPIGAPQFHHLGRHPSFAHQLGTAISNCVRGRKQDTIG
jgi:hypothetical protein